MKKNLIKIVTYITIVTFVGFLIIVSIDEIKSMRKISKNNDNNMIIKYDHIYEEDNDDNSKVNDYNGSSKEKSYVLPNADKNQPIEILPL